MFQGSLRCSKYLHDVPSISVMFQESPLSSKDLHDVPRISAMFQGSVGCSKELLSVPRISAIFQWSPRCSKDLWDVGLIGECSLRPTLCSLWEFSDNCNKRKFPGNCNERILLVESGVSGSCGRNSEFAAGGSRVMECLLLLQIF